MTSFTRTIIVLHFTRSALNTQTAPPNQVLIGLALFLTFFIMGPAISEINETAYTPYLDGEITVLFGTHTHVQTADEKITESGMGYITDIGMTGPKKSVIGMDILASIKRFETSLPEKYKLAEGKAMFNSCIFEIDDKTNKVIKIERYNKN